MSSFRHQLPSIPTYTQQSQERERGNTNIQIHGRNKNSINYVLDRCSYLSAIQEAALRKSKVPYLFALAVFLLRFLVVLHNVALPHVLAFDLLQVETVSQRVVAGQVEGAGLHTQSASKNMHH